MAHVTDFTLRKSRSDVDIDQNIKVLDKYSYLTTFIRKLYKIKSDSFLLYILYYDKTDPKNSEIVMIPYNFEVRGRNFFRDLYEVTNKLINTIDRCLSLLVTKYQIERQKKDVFDFFSSVANRVFVDRDFYSVFITKRDKCLYFSRMQLDPEDHDFDRFFEAILNFANESGLCEEGSYE